MEQATLNKLKEQVKRPHDNYIFKWLNESEDRQAKKAVLFIEALLKVNVPLNAINVNDWDNSPVKIYVGVPFQHKIKTFKRFSWYDMQRFFKSKDYNLKEVKE